MDKEKLEIRKVFVTGIYGSGKTRFAKDYARARAIPYIDFDSLFSYDLPDKQCADFLGSLPDAFVVDAIPIDANRTWGEFSEWEARNDALVVCAYCPDPSTWYRRVQEKAYRSVKPVGARERLKLLYRILRLRFHRNPPLAIDVAHHRGKYRNFFIQNLPFLARFRNVRYYDSLRREYSSREEMLERIGYRTFALEEHLDRLGKDHDRNYQDIELLGLVGYSESWKTWDRIRELVDWKGKTVSDLGCFHGYFSFKAEDRGAKVTGFDRSPAVLEVARLINEARGGKVAFRQWLGGEAVPPCDIVLCLNVLHHFGDTDRALSGMDCREAIFEVKNEHRDAVARRFDVVREVPSHRENRIILLVKRRG
ncbi:MAG TPA: class I SAM-dependent methyltransferase [Candidatus Deferrimicrobiaceae bacterium]